VIDPTPTDTRTTAVATLVEPDTGSGRGTPALIAAVLVVGALAAFGRVVISFVPTVDERSGRRHRA
jgi:hypothetical protein